MKIFSWSLLLLFFSISFFNGIENAEGKDFLSSPEKRWGMSFVQVGLAPISITDSDGKEILRADNNAVNFFTSEYFLTEGIALQTGYLSSMGLSGSYFCSSSIPIILKVYPFSWNNFSLWLAPGFEYTVMSYLSEIDNSQIDVTYSTGILCGGIDYYFNPDWSLDIAYSMSIGSASISIYGIPMKVSSSNLALGATWHF